MRNLSEEGHRLHEWNCYYNKEGEDTSPNKSMQNDDNILQLGNSDKKQKIVHLHKSPARFNLNLKLVYYRFSYWKFDHLKLIQCYFSVVCMIAFSFMH